MRRGVVVGPTFIPSDGTQEGYHGDLKYKLELDSLRYALLFWDVIDFSAMESFMMRDSFLGPSNPELDLLKAEGLAVNGKPPAGLDVELAGRGLYIQEIPLYSQLASLVHLNKSNDCEWSLFQTQPEVFIPKEASIIRAATEFSLFNMLPIPASDVPLEDVLSFREKRQPELLALRDVIDTFTARICSAENTVKEAEKVKSTLERELENYSKVVGELDQNVVFKSITKVATDEFVALSGLLGALATLFTAIPASIPSMLTLGAGAAASVKLAIKDTPTCAQLPDSLKNYAYLLSAQRELV
ncbi:DUF6236 family protein [Vibrio sp. CyArs1]|uniref:DUF6236 family protein n=1 Tax=Vibrio sp. CyArs1 TaxID=2682577 RepID=UPI001F070089|nr:DUF6236 family protein [Vibrio sp. CyArs1]